jgi:quercetin dioxygenase-like cupin family protein
MKNLPSLVRAADLAAYAPANHTGTSNVRVIGPETVGATALEVLVGTIVKSHGARPHAHPYLEQCAYMIEGTGESEAHGRTEALAAGSWSYVPAGVFHTFRVTSDRPARLLVVYAPPYGENPAQTITAPDAALPPARGAVRVLAGGDAATGAMPLITAETVGAQWVDVTAVRLPAAGALACSARGDAEQVLYLESGRIEALADAQAFQIGPGDFLFLPPGAAADLRCLPDGPASGFLIQGRMPPDRVSSPNPHPQGATP